MHHVPHFGVCTFSPPAQSRPIGGDSERSSRRSCDAEAEEPVSEGRWGPRMPTVGEMVFLRGAPGACTRTYRPAPGATDSPQCSAALTHTALRRVGREAKSGGPV